MKPRRQAARSRSHRLLAATAAALLRNRLAVRAPIVLCQARLGFLFGSRLLMLEHAGRKSGARRRVVLEVVDHTAPGTYIVAAGFGTRAQWFRNVRADPRVRVSVGSHAPVTATARLLTPQQAASALTAYATRHPRTWASFRSVFETTLGSRIDKSGTTLPMVALDLTDTGGR